MKKAKIRHVLESKKGQVAPGLYIDRPLPQGEIKNWDPFLMLDHFGPAQLPKGKENVIDDHPHRGFEPVTFLFSGKAEHRDSLGNKATVNSGGVQWITAGSGLVHSERLSYDDGDETRTINGIQLWVNLPIKHKMTEPTYQNLQKEDIPSIEDNGVTVRVIAGDLLGQKGPAKTFSPITAAHLIFEENTTLSILLKEGFNTMLHMAKGFATIAGIEVPAKAAALTDEAGELAINAEAGTEILFLSGEPLNEPVASYGPFVMNNMRQIYEAIDDYEKGRMGVIEKD